MNAWDVQQPREFINRPVPLQANKSFTHLHKGWRANDEMSSSHVLYSQKKLKSGLAETSDFLAGGRFSSQVITRFSNPRNDPRIDP